MMIACFTRAAVEGRVGMKAASTSKNQKKHILLVIMCVCIVCLLGTCLLTAVANRSGMSTVLSVQTCLGVVTKPRFQMGLAWASPISSYRPPLMFSRYKVCVELPPSLAPTTINGEFAFPP